MRQQIYKRWKKETCSQTSDDKQVEKARMMNLKSCFLHSLHWSRCSVGINPKITGSMNIEIEN